jgi:photosystem II stability/assembly factor-like uncharacterized protein
MICVFMKRKFALLFLALIFCPRVVAHAQWRPQDSRTTADLRGLSVVNHLVAWASGTGGTYARTIDGGATWRASTVPGGEKLDLRDVHAIDANTAYLLSAGAGELSRIYKTTDGGEHWTLQYTNTKPEAFFDALAFWDATDGIALSDPVAGHFLIVTTSDGGANWQELPTTNLPPALPGEAAFAASGTCLIVQGKNNVWFGTGGGAVARVFRSRDRGRTWKVATTPVTSNTKSSGIFSLAFKDSKNGIALGGDYQKPDSAKDNVALTTDGGLTWKAISGSLPAGFRSGVAYVSDPRRKSVTLVAVGPSGSDYSIDDSRTWKSIDRVGYNTVAFAGPDAGWVVGPSGRIAKWVPAGPKTK